MATQRTTDKGSNMKAILALAVLAAVGLAGCGTSTSGGSATPATGGSTHQSGPLKVVFLYGNPPNTPAWEATFEQARKQLQADFGNAIVTSYKVAPDDPSAASDVENLIRGGANLIIGTSYGHGKMLISEAQKHPGVHFMVTEFTPPSNLTNIVGYDIGIEDGWYLAGMSIGAVMKQQGASKAGWLDGFAIPYELRSIDAFTLGMQKMVPGATTQTVITNSWYDPAKESEAASGLVSAGAGSIAEGLSSPSAGKVATQYNKPFGAVYALTTFAPKVQITGPSYQWAALIKPYIQKLLNGEDTWKPILVYDGAKEGAISISPFGPMYNKFATPAEKQEVAKARQQLDSGQLTVLPGSVQQLESLNYVVPGVSGINNVPVKKVTVTTTG
jgi:basic membrane protein A and related proteins